jgi:3-deoxy-D-manno-octulosonic-acid transferase
MSWALSLYRAGTGLVEPFAPMILERRVQRGKEDPARIGERLGHPSVQRPEGPLVWLHGASVGESLSLLAVIAGLKAARPELVILVTAGTTTAAELLSKRLPEGVIHQYVPVDAPGAADRFLDHWRPSLAIFVESELWPNLLMGAKARGVRLALISARMGERSARGWARAPGAAMSLFEAFDLVLPQDDASATRLVRLGARDGGRLNLKFAGEALPVDEAVVSMVQATVGEHPILLAASTHPGEDEIVLDAFATVADAPGRPLLVIVPRHPVRGPEIALLARARGFETRLRSLGEAPTAARVYVADTLGELGAWFRLSRLAMICGSFTPGVGGHNPLEALRLGCPALTGPHVENWRAVYEELLTHDDVVMLADPAELAGRLALAVGSKDTARAGAAVALLEEKARELHAAVAQLVDLIP